HALVHAVHREKRAVTVAVSGGEYAAQDDEAGQREGPEAEVSSKSPQCALGARRQVENKVAGDGERGSRQQRQEIDHRSTRVGSGGLMLLNARRPRAARAPDDSGEWRSEEHTSELQSQSNLVCRL